MVKISKLIKIISKLEESKSAQFPFLFWHPTAMAAQTYV